MIPVQLTIKGLFSYANAETIDFNPLVTAKLFGIFGPVGSGKSAILEAIMFVLFDRSARLNKAGDDRYYNMMNLQSNELIIDFIFKGGRNNKTKYRFYFMARRNAKNFQKVEVRDRSYYQWSKNDWQPLNKPDILGMTYENFMQTVIIPQGKFREFIDQKPKDRTQMLKELFNLDRFDIASQAFRMLGQVKEQHKFTAGQLSQYEEINKVLIKQLEKEISTLETAIQKKNDKEQDLSKRLADMQLLQHQHNELMEVSSSLAVLESEAEFFRRKQVQLTKYLRVQSLFKEKIAQQQQLLLKARTKEQELDQLITSIERLEKEVGISKERWENAQTANARKEHLQHQIADLELLVRLKQQQYQYDEVDRTWERASNVVLKLSEKILTLEEQIEQSRMASARRLDSVSALQKFEALKEWWAVNSDKRGELALMEKEIMELEKDLDLLKLNKDEIKRSLVANGGLNKEISLAQEEIQSLKLQEAWNVHVNHLKEGKPCPLCGATSHPKPLVSKKPGKSVGSAKGHLKQLEKRLEVQRDLTQQFEIIEVKIKEKQKTLTNHHHKRKLMTENLDKHGSKYPGETVPTRIPVDLDQKIESTEKSIEQFDKEILLLNSRLQQHQGHLSEKKNHQDQLDKLALRREKLRGQMDQLTGMIKTLKAQEFLKKSEAQLSELIVHLREQIRTMDRDYQESLNILTRVEKELNHQKGLLQSSEVHVNEIKTQNITLESEMQALCKKESLKGIKEVQNILSLNLNAEQEQTELEKYRANLNSMRARQKSIRRKMGKNQYHETRHAELSNEYHSLKSSLSHLGQQLASKQHTRQQYQTQLKKKESLAEDLQKLTIRRDHIQEISNLLRGNGFINFISSVYLQNLCKAANFRFKKLTANNLSLELNEQNEFMVRDYLNEGKLRLLKTLSGGQIFQASLSLALSLAENVKKLNQAEQSFFFLDEGFGSLDSASLQLVFETLKSLQKENRIVGIISHVEELQMEIDTYLTVRQDPEVGSVITRSWE